jgi:hypothetical protein
MFMLWYYFTNVYVVVLFYRDIIIYPHMKCRWNRTILDLCGIVVAILKMATCRNFSMSGINSGHHYLPTYQILMISRIDSWHRKISTSRHFQNGRHNTAQIQHCSISTSWIDCRHWKLSTGHHFQNGRHNTAKIQHCSTMLNLCDIVAAILKMATGRNFSMSGINSGHHYLPTYQILMISDNVEFLRYCCGHFEHFICG